MRLHDGMKMSDDRTIQIPQQLVSAMTFRNIPDFRKRKMRSLLRQTKRLISNLKKLDVFPNEQIKTISQINDCAKNESVPVPASIDFRIRPFPGPLGIALPEINAGTKPVEIFVARTKFLQARKNANSDISVATVVAKDKRCCETRQLNEFYVV